MNREIKFRGQKVDTKEWIYGFYAEEPFIDKYGTLHIRDVSPTIDGIYVIPETIGQYTGLKDKNGKDIYEGDIVKLIAYIPDKTKEFIGIVEYVDGSYIVANDDLEEGRFLFDEVSDCFVLGNIYENPELLEKVE